MISGSIEIQRGDYTGGGKASAQIKNMLSSLGISYEIMKKAMIAVFEAEMNIIIHSYGGKIFYKVDEEKLEIEAIDNGPGISDVILAMKEGYSTAPPEARELGYGAGMGLPNIKKNTDFFYIASSGKGTIIKFFIKLYANESFEEIDLAVECDSKKCKKCLACVRECPTRAIRIKEGEVIILAHRCINCNRCVEVCPTGVFNFSLVHKNLDLSSSFMESTNLILPNPIAGKLYSEGKWLSCKKHLKEKYNIDLVSLFPWELALRKAITEYIRSPDTKYSPIISPVCPSVIQWLQTEYPSLTIYIAPYLYPFLACIEFYSSRGRVIYVPLCASQVVAVKSLYKNSDRVELLHPQMFYELIRGIDAEPIFISEDSGSTNLFIDESQSVMGIISVKRFLDKFEKGKVAKNLKYVELYNCYGGCYGFPFTDIEPYSLKAILREKGFYDFNGNLDAKSVFRASELKMRKGIRLGANMKESLQKLSLIEDVYKGLPGRDCAVCGAPRCLEFAEEVAIYNVSINRCPYLENKKGE